MATINDAVNADLSGYTEMAQPSTIASNPSSGQQPGFNPMLRSPIPPIWQTTSDSLRQFYNGNVVPQRRLLTPSSSTSGSSPVASKTNLGVVKPDGITINIKNGVISGATNSTVALTNGAPVNAGNKGSSLFDPATNKLYIYDGTAWKSVVLT